MLITERLMGIHGNDLSECIMCILSHCITSKIREVRFISNIQNETRKGVIS